MLGEGLYWTKPLTGTLDRWEDESNYRASWSDKQFVGKAAWNDPLHYSNRSLINVESNQDALLAIRRPSLEILKDNLFFPGHRFIQIYGLAETFLSPTYNFRPWDDLLNLPCPEDVPVIDGHRVPIPDLHPRIVTDTNGDEWLVYDDVQLVYYGNGLPSDIVSLGDHNPGTDSGIEPDEVTHKLYTTTQPLAGSGEEVVEFDTLTPTTDESICTDDPIYDSANRACPCATDSIEDYIDGYPSETGNFEYDETDGYIGDDAGRIVWAQLLDIPLPASEPPTELLFRVGSGIRSADHKYKPYRLDCSCSQYGCETEVTVSGGEQVDRCNIGHYIDQAGDLNFDCDMVDIFRTMILQEQISTCSFVLNGEISSLFLLDENKVTFDTSGPVPVGSFKFIDEWGTIHTAEFKTVGDTLDIMWTSMEPRVWGEPATGFTEGTRVFRKGIITTQRQILRSINGQIFVVAEGGEQSVGYFQSNLACGDVRFLDPFLFHVDCAVTDQIEFEILCGPKWADPAMGSGDSSFWPGLAFDSGGTDGDVIIEPYGVGSEFFWIDAWGNDEGVSDITACRVEPEPPVPSVEPFSGHSTLVNQLVSYWKLDGNGNDAHGPHDLTLVNAPSASPGKINQCLCFNGTSQGMSYPNHLDFQATEFTVTFWINYTDLTPFRFVIGKTTPAAWNTGWGHANPNTGGNDLRFFYRDWASHHITVAGLGAVWHHFVLRLWEDGGQTYISQWINGALAGQTSYGDAFNPDTVNPLTFAYDGAGSYLEGCLDEIGYWSRKLTDAEVADLYNGGLGLTY
jgi:hypothetical protein